METLGQIGCNLNLSKRKKVLSLPFIFQFLFIFLVLFLLLFFRNNSLFATVAVRFVSITLEALPFILLGSLVSGFIEVFVSKDTLAKLIPKNKVLAILVASGLGFLFPVCECGIVPVVRRLIKKGFPVGCAVSYMLAGPIVNPVVGLSTFFAYSFNLNIVFLRIICGYMIAVFVGGIIWIVFSKKETMIISFKNSHSSKCGCGHSHDEHHHDNHNDGDGHNHNGGLTNHHNHVPDGLLSKLTGALLHSANDCLDIGRFLVIGAFFASVTQTVISLSDLRAVSGSPVLSLIGMMVMAVLMNLCSEADAFVAASFASVSVPFLAQMGFMVLGPMLDIKLMLMYFGLFKKRAIIMISAVVFLSVFFLMIMLKYFVSV